MTDPGGPTAVEPRFVARLIIATVDGRPAGPTLMRALQAIWADPNPHSTVAAVTELLAAHRRRMSAMHIAYRRRNR